MIVTTNHRGDTLSKELVTGCPLGEHGSAGAISVTPSRRDLASYPGFLVCTQVTSRP